MPKKETVLRIDKIPAMKTYMELVKRLDKVQRNGLRKPMTEEDVNALKNSHKEVQTVCTELLGNPESKLGKEDRKKLIRISDHIYKEAGLLELVKKDENGMLPTYHEALRISSRMIVDVSGKKLESVGGAMSHRIPLEVVDANGVHRKGFFTKHLRQGEHKNWSNALHERQKDDPNIENAVKELEKIPFDNIIKAVLGKKARTEDLFKEQKEWKEEIKKYGPGDHLRENYRELFQKLNVDVALLDTLNDIDLLYLTDAFKGYYLQDRQNRLVKIQDNEVLGKRNNAMSEVASMVGRPDILAKSTDMTILENGQLVQGVFMENAKGFRPDSIVPDNPAIGLKRIKFDTPQIKKSLAELQMIDYICGNIDRHSGNFHIILEEDEDGLKAVGVQGIDNDMSFTDNDVDFEPKNMTRLNELGVIGKDVADKILNLKEETFKQALERQGLGVPGIERAWIRVQQVQERIREGIRYYENKPAEEKIPKWDKILVLEDNEWENIKFKSLTDLLQIQRGGKSQTVFQSFLNTARFHREDRREFRNKDENIRKNKQENWIIRNTVDFIEVKEIQKERLKLLDQKERYEDLYSQFQKTENKGHKNSDEYKKMVESFRELKEKFGEMAEQYIREGGYLSDSDYHILKGLQQKAVKQVEDYISKKSKRPKTEFGRNRLGLAKNLRSQLGLNVDELKEDMMEAFMKEQNAELKKIKDIKELKDIRDTKEKNLKKQVERIDIICEKYPEGHKMRVLGGEAAEMMKEIGAAILDPNGDMTSHMYSLAWVICYEKAHEMGNRLNTNNCDGIIENSVEKMLENERFKELEKNITKDKMYELVTDHQKREDLFLECLGEKKKQHVKQEDGGKRRETDEIKKDGQVLFNPN